MKAKFPGPGAAAGWAAARKPRGGRDDRLAAVRELRKLGIPWRDIRRLIRRLREADAARTIIAAWPSATEDRLALVEVQRAAGRLATIIDGLSPRARAELSTALLGAGRDVNAHGHVAEGARGIEFAMMAWLTQHPPGQDRREAPVHLVRAVAETIGVRLGPPSRAPNSRFRRAAVAAFVLAGCPGSPDRAIDALIDERKVP